MNNYNNLSSKEILGKIQRNNSQSSILTGTSAVFSAILVPIIITTLNKLSGAENTSLIIALTIVCCISIVSMVIGVTVLYSNKSAVSALHKDLDDLEHFMTNHLEQDGQNIRIKGDVNSALKNIPKKMLKQK